MGQAPCAVKALCLEASVAQHLDNLRVLLALLLEHELAFLIVVLVLTPTSVLAALVRVLVAAAATRRHGGSGAGAGGELSIQPATARRDVPFPYSWA